MSHKLKIISYALIILFVLVLPSQADAQCYTPDACQDLALEMGLGPFKGSGSYQTKGCYAISTDSPHNNHEDVWFGTGGSQAEIDQQPTVSKYQYRLCGPNAAPQAAEAQAAEAQAAAKADEAGGGEEEKNPEGRSISEVRHSMCKTKAREACYEYVTNGDLYCGHCSMVGDNAQRHRLANCHTPGHDAIMSGGSTKKYAPEARGPDGSWILPMAQREYATVYTSCSASKTAEEVKKHRYWK
jgi:hypothetical protein